MTEIRHDAGRGRFELWDGDTFVAGWIDRHAEYGDLLADAA